MSWNPVLDKFIEIKNDHIKEFGNISYDYTSGYTDESKSCIEQWVDDLTTLHIERYDQYAELIEPLEINQYGTLILVRYGRYSNVYDCEEEASGEGFWDKYGGFYKECRSVVIDIKEEVVVCATMKKFFNINEVEETSLENIQRRINNAKCVEFSNKLDGSMQSARWYNDHVVMAGSQALDPEKSWRLADGYRMLNENPNYIRMLKTFPYYTFTFEYISQKDAHIVKYTKEQEGLYLIAIRDCENGSEFNYHTILRTAQIYGIPTTEIINKTLDQIMNELDDKSSDEAEGFVINIEGYRCKLKYNDYVLIHRALSKLSSINMIIRSIANDTYDDLLSKLPMIYHQNVNKVAAIVIKYVEDTQNEIVEWLHKAPGGSKKDFMIWCDKVVPKHIRSFVKAKYLDQSYNVLVSASGKYKKLKDMGIDNYNEIFN